MTLHRTPLHHRALRLIRDGLVVWQSTVPAPKGVLGRSPGFAHANGQRLDPSLLVALWELRAAGLIDVSAETAGLTTAGACRLSEWDATRRHEGARYRRRCRCNRKLLAVPRAPVRGGHVLPCHGVARSTTREEDSVSADEKPREGDKVRVTFEETVYEEFGELRVHSPWHSNLNSLKRLAEFGATVEVLERADDPFKDLEGTIRREDHDDGFSLWQSTLTALLRSRWLCTYSTSYGNRGEYVDHDDVVGMPVVGSAPGTPAAEAEKPAHGLFQTASDEHAAATAHSKNTELREVTL